MAVNSSREVYELNKDEVHKMLRQFGYVTNSQAADIAQAIDYMQFTGADAASAIDTVHKFNDGLL